jgi:DNA-binding HxlR family transcriptional regulator
MIRRNRLTSTNEYRTVVRVEEEPRKVDATTKSLLRQLQELEREEWRIREKVRAIHTALKLAGIKPDVKTISSWGQDEHEAEYARQEPFAETTLTEACEKVLKDYADKWLTKSQVEYLITRGGYKSSAKDAKNSVDVTLRRLAGDGRCDVKRVRGSRGNTYRWISPEVKEKE